MFQNIQEAREAFRAVHSGHNGAGERFGIYLPGVQSFLPDSFKSEQRGYSMAMDAQPSLVTDPNSGIPWFLTNYVDPAVYKILQAPVEAANIYGERRTGNWTTTTAMFLTVEHTGETSSYDDYVNNGESNANANFPQRQNYLYQTIKQYGELEIARAGEARINWVSELDGSAANNMMRFENFMYFFGIQGLENYGGLNDPSLPASLTPATKAYGGTTWFSGNQLKATPNEVYNDILAVYTSLVNQTDGYVDSKSKLTLAMSPGSATAMKAANSFGVNTYELLEENLPNLTIKTATQYNQTSASNPQGIAAGNFMQMIADEVGGQKTGYASFSEKMRSHPIIREMSAFKQKVTGGGFGVIWRIPIGVASMVGI
jgi:hypothetical protein